MNWYAVRAIYVFEMARTGRTVWQSIVSPVISTSLYFVVFGAAIGSRISEIDGIAYGAFIVPGLIMLMLLTQSTTNASFGIYFPRFVGTIYEHLSAPVSYLEIVLGFVGAALVGAAVQPCGLPRQRFPARCNGRLLRLTGGRLHARREAFGEFGVRFAGCRQHRQRVLGLRQDRLDHAMHQQVGIAPDRAGEVRVGLICKAEVPAVDRRVDRLLHRAQQCLF